MMKNVNIEYHESGLIISQVGVSECVVVPNLLKFNFYEEILNACLDGNPVSWSDLNANRLLMNYEYKNHFNCFLNGLFVGDLPFIKLSDTSIAIPVETTDEEQLFEVYDSELVECYLLEKEEILE